MATMRHSHPKRPRSLSGCLLTLLAAAVISVIGALLVSILSTYAWVAAQLPPADELQVRTHKFATTKILDAEGNLLWEIIDPTGGRRTHVTLNQIAPDLLVATLATEDRFFYVNFGIDPIAIARATFDNLTEQRIVSGGSTITQQLARNVFLSPQERSQKTLDRKIKEAVLAIEISRRYTKNQILEIYLNQIYYGNLAYGIEAAAQTYFGKPASRLTLPEAAMLAGLPQSPALHDPYLNYKRAKARQREVLGLMAESGYISLTQAEAAAAAELDFRPPEFSLKAPHFVTMVRQELEQIVPPDYIYRVGLTVHTTLDPRLQAVAKEAIETQVTALAGRNVTNAALVTLDVETGQVKALIGSRDFQDWRINGQVNMVTSPRQPGSTMKPFTYLAAFERLNWTPSTLLMDTPVSYPQTDGADYRPTNVDLRFHGPVSVRTALANSYNVPAVKALEAVGVEALKEMAARLGITTLTRDDYGLSLTLGSGEVSLLEMTGAYQALANRGVLVKPTTILRITDSLGRVIEPLQPQSRRVLREEHAYLMTDILADNEARRPAFGLDSPLRLSRPAAAKTGTTTDWRDNWTIGYTPDLVTGVWVGNADNTPMHEVGGVMGAAPIWHIFMEQAHAELPARNFLRPPAIIDLEVCADSGVIPGEACPQRRTEIFFKAQPPLGPEFDMHKFFDIDMNTNLLASEFCRANVMRRYFRVFPPDGRDWALRRGIEQPPTRSCPSDDIVAAVTSPADQARLGGVITVTGSAVAQDFAFYQLELGPGDNPQAFRLIQRPTFHLKDHDILATFDTTQIENGLHTLRLVVFDQTGGYTDARVRLFVENPPELIAIQTPVTTPPATPTPTVTTTLVLNAPLPPDRPPGSQGGPPLPPTPWQPALPITRPLQILPQSPPDPASFFQPAPATPTTPAPTVSPASDF